MNALQIVLLIISTVVLSIGACFADYYITAKKEVLLGLIPAGAIWVIDLLVLVIMLAVKADIVTTLVVYFVLQIAVVVAVIFFVVFRKKRRAGAIAEHQRELRLQTARKMEEEKHRRLLETLKGFTCAESGMKPEGQREIVAMSKSGKTVFEIANVTGADAEEIDTILNAFERYNSRVNGEFGTSDLILTPEQEEAIVTNVINSLPYDHSIAAQLWTRQSVRALAADIIDAPVSIRIISAYMKHWGFTVPVQQTVKFRSERPDVKNWLADGFGVIREKAAAQGGEILWIYTVPLDSVRDISTYMPKNPVMLCAVSNDGSVAFKVYDISQVNAFDDFVDGLCESFKTKIFAVINERYDEYEKIVGREKLRYLSDKIEIFKCG